MIHVFTYDEGKAKQLLTVEPSLPGAWYITCVAAEEAFDDYESQFDEIFESFAWC